MYSILIVDDEKNVTESLKESIPWADLDVENVYTAGNGYQALGILSNMYVDLVIADIQMPLMDGLELVKEIRSTHPGVRCIFLTAYDRFEYAVQALKLGADNYILKPVSMMEMTQTIESTLDNLYAERESRDTVFQENMIRRWLNGNISSSELTEKASFLPVSVYLHNYVVAAVATTDAGSRFQDFLENCRTELTAKYDAALLCDNYERYVFLVGGRQILQESIREIIDRTVRAADIQEHVALAVSPVVTDCMKVHMCYRSVTEYLNKLHAPADIHGSYVLYSETPSPGTDVLQPSLVLSPVVARTVAMIRKHYSEGISLKTVSSQMNVNTAYLGYLFKKETGVYFNSYLNDYRVDQAAELLCRSYHSVNDIAGMVGFATSSHFITTFRKKYGISPLKYRLLHMEET